ncbi:hypothetical protein GCM10009839_73510 [Catenulispora yoronensis]|uniref:Leucine-rich repeat domain-containing protein n=1 Tax=Catenulispora yoronensis TaxID=450799 RepID=A0ABP5GQX9_9ACTN
MLTFPADPEAAVPVPEGGAGAVAWRLDCRGEDDEYHDRDFAELLDAFLDHVDGARVRALVTGLWTYAVDIENDRVARDLAAVADRLPALRSLFISELVEDQMQLSWLFQKPVTPVLAAFPQLEELWLRGTADGAAISESERMAGYDDSLVEPETKHAALRKLVMQSGGLPAGVIRAIATCDFPELTHLEIYLGSPEYGGDGTLEDLASFLDGSRFPKLRHLGLKDAEFQDEIAAAVAQAPVVARLETLDLSLGTLGDEGAAALLAGQPLDHLRRLDLSHHYLSEGMRERLRQAWPTVEVDLSDHQDPEWGRYIAVGE